MPGASTVGPVTSEPRSGEPEPEPPKPWTELETIRSWPPVNDEPFVSEGHAGRYRVDVRVSPDARSTYVNLVRGSVMPDTTWVAKFHRDASTGDDGPIFGMYKRGEGDWEFLEADADGKVVARGDLRLCRRCHAEGKADHLFGLPARPD